MTLRLPVRQAASTLFALTALCCAVILSPERATGQTSTEEILKAINEVKKQLPPTPTPAPGSVDSLVPQYDKKESDLSKEAQWYEEAQVNKYRGTPIPYLSHLKGKSGIPFPKPEEVVLKPVPTDTPAPPTPTYTPEPTFTPYPKPVRCEKSETIRDDTYAIDQKESLLYDYIFISRDLVPLDSEEYFGPDVHLIPYDTPLTEGQLLRMEIYGVPCLPYRIRKTTTADYQDIGLNALKNYSKDPAGRGVFHPTLQQKLFPSKRP